MQTSNSIPFLLASDIDGTMIGDQEGEFLMRDFTQQRKGQFTLAYITGREISSVLQLVESGRLPPPDFICGNVGTILVDCNDPENALGKRFAAQVGPEWNLEELYNLGEGDGIRRQEFLFGQPPHQAGFDWNGDSAALDGFLARVGHLPHVYIQWSYNRYIDILPASLGKGNAVRFLRASLGLPESRVMVAGDAGNDRQMFETGFQGVVPSNGLDELKHLAVQPWHYHSPYPAARGVLDGLRHFGLI